jgi:MtaA/CmuA family methyltransferase
MNSFERYLATLKGRPVDHLARVPILMDFAARHIGSNYGAFASDYRVLVEANLRCAADFGFDQLSAISDPYREVQGFGAEIEFVSDGVPRCPHPPLSDDRDLRILPAPNPFAPGRMLDRVRAVESFKASSFRKYSILGWVEGPAAEAAALRGVENFLMDLMEDDTYTEDLMDLCVENAIRFAAAQLAAGADTIGVGDAICSQVSPAVYEARILPRQKRLVDSIHAAGGYVRLHICGNITHLLPGIRTLGVDILDVDHLVSLERARAALGPRVALLGNLDPVAAVLRSSPDEIRAATRAAYAVAGAPFMVGAGCEIPPGTPDENLKALCEPVAP